MQFTYPGLSGEAVVLSRAKHGSNAITPRQVEGFWDKFIENLKNPIIVILMVALGITVILALLGYAHWYEGFGIAMAVLIAAIVATWSEFRNEAEFQKLLEQASLIRVKTFRNGHLGEIPIGDLVVGDFLLLQPGDTMPADGVLIAGHLEVSEAALTGESEPIKKTTREGGNELWRASLVEDGEGVMRVGAVGDQTRYGATMKELISAEDRLSPLQEKLTVLGKQISTFGYIGAAFIALAFLFNHIFLQNSGLAEYLALPAGQIIHHIVTALILSIIIIVVAVPEGLPMMIAIVLSINMRKLLASNVLVRKLLGIETAGSLTILFSDKTGTLTEGRLAVAEFISTERGHFQRLQEIPAQLRELLMFALRNNTSAVIDTSSPADIKLVGADRTEQALLRFVGAELANLPAADLLELIPFSSQRKFSAMQVQGSRKLTLVKGAPEIVLQHCGRGYDADGQIIAFDREALNADMRGLSERAMRLIAVAATESPISADQSMPNDLILIGILGLRDNLRGTSLASVRRARRAGIQVVMITGDSRETAQAIAQDAGLLEESESKVITSGELAKLSDAEVKKLLPHLHVVARAFPTDKSRLVRLAKELGWVVGMTGDGVNDAPAVRSSDVGFAMGSGTEMTKESSDIVVLDDNFFSITQSVLYGRTLFKSIRKFLTFQLTVSASAILLAFLGPFLGFDLPLTMVQLLWINLIMDTLAALAFSGEAALERYMKEKPIPKDDSLITGEMAFSVVVNSLAVTALSLFFLKSDFIYHLFLRPDTPLDLPRDQNLVFLTAFFAFFAFIHNFNKFNVRTDSLNLFDHLSKNHNFITVVSLIFILQVIFTYFGGEVLRTVGLLPMEWVYVLAMSFVIIPVDLARKYLRNVLFGNPLQEK